MAAQAAENLGASAQREPSMEEILASIRRIIEDSDGGKSDTLIPEPANSSAAPSRSEIEAYRRELDLPQARIEPVTEPLATPVETAPEILRAAEPVIAPPAAMGRPEAAKADVPVQRPVVDAKLVTETAPEVLQDRIPDNQYADVEPLAAAASPAPVATAKSNIISEVAGRQVAAAFGELTEAFAATRRRTFDEVAEEMMRPMLQDWLDNNLPTLVEKLVREEIERIARGGSR